VKQVATVLRVGRYPVKSMRGDFPASAQVTLQGVAEDRRYAFVQTASQSLFPYFTAREYPDLLRYQPSIERGPEDRIARVTVRTPDGAVLPVGSDELRVELESRSGRPLFLLRDYRGSYDVAQVSIISAATIRAIEQETGAALDPTRFRANLLVGALENRPFPEDAWIGRTLRIGGSVRIAVTEADVRCMMVTLDPSTGEATPGVLRSVARLHDTAAGVYGSVLTPGAIACGDPILLE
jgi:MOSC domain-containing protein